MSFINNKTIRLKLLAGCATVLVFVILFFGLRPKDFSFSNQATWVKDQPGIRFEKYGMAYSQPIINSASTDFSVPNGFSIEIALKPQSFNDEGFNFILSFHDGKDRDQLLPESCMKIDENHQK